jgi:hypothetical protein
MGIGKKKSWKCIQGKRQYMLLTDGKVGDFLTEIEIFTFNLRLEERVARALHSHFFENLGNG